MHQGAVHVRLGQNFSFSRRPTGGPKSTVWTTVWWARGDAAGDMERGGQVLAAVGANLQHLASDVGSALLVLDCTGHPCSQS